MAGVKTFIKRVFLGETVTFERSLYVTVIGQARLARNFHTGYPDRSGRGRGATENTSRVDDNLLARGLDPTLPRLFNGSANICTRRRRSGTTQTRPSGSCATWPGVWSMRNRASRAASWRGWRRSSPSSASLPAPTSSTGRHAEMALTAAGLTFRRGCWSIREREISMPSWR